MKKLLISISITFLVLVTTFFKAEAGDAFWYGENIPDPPATSLHNYLTNSVLPDLVQSIMGFNNSNGDKELQIYKSNKTWDGYTLLSSLSPHVTSAGAMYTILIDMQGKIVKEWPLYPFPAKMLPGGHVIAGSPQGGLEGHQEMGALVQMDWCGKAVWSFPGFGMPGGARQHHDFQREGNPVGYYAPFMEPKATGKTLVLTHYNPDQAITANVSDKPLEDDALYELDAKGKKIWEWHAWEHFDQMGFDDAAKQAVKTIAVGAPADIGGGFAESDWQHINDANYLGPNKWHAAGDQRFHPDNIIWDGRSSNIIAIIARHDDHAGRWKSGDIVWRVGPNYSIGNKEYKLGQIIGQHHAHMIPWSLPGGGNILIFDNGGLAGFGPLFPGLPPYWPNTYRNYSRVIEFNPRTLEIEWEYKNIEASEGNRKFFSWFISSAQRLPNGNTLITEGADGRVFEVTRKGEIVWEFISPWNAPPGSGFGNSIYRAYRVPYDWVPKNQACK